MKNTKTSASSDGSTSPVAHSARTLKERYAAGKALREACPREAHALWKSPAGRPDPVQLVLNAEKGRVPNLLPLRHGRMVRSPCTFDRGAALTMASDLASTPVSGIRVEIVAPEVRIDSIAFPSEPILVPWCPGAKRVIPAAVNYAYGTEC